MPHKSIIAFAVRILLLLFASAANLAAQEEGLRITPPELYPGKNVVTISVPSGIREIRVATTSNVKIEGWGGITNCQQNHDLNITVTTTSGQIYIQLTVIDCDNRRITDTSLRLNTQWTLDRVRFGSVEQGKEICREFRIRSDERDTWLDSITIHDPNVRLDLSTSLPILIRKGDIFRYTVCFHEDQIGLYEFPVLTWMRRDYPSGGMGNYSVADTGEVRVIPRRDPDPPPITDPPDTIQTIDIPAAIEPEITDPTTFRSIAVPNAVIPPAGSAYIGVYDLLGLSAGYSVTDNVMIVAGGGMPTPDDWGGISNEMFAAISLGIKGGIALGKWNVALGYQWGRSLYDRAATPNRIESEITVHVPYFAVSYGNNDRRVSFTGGYAFKRHITLTEGAFDRNASIVAIGGDHRVGRHWKIAGEVMSMESLGVVPVVFTARYFGDWFAIDAGLAWLGLATGNAQSPSILIAPVVSAVLVF